MEVEGNWGHHQFGSYEDQANKVYMPCVKEGNIVIQSEKFKIGK